MNKQRGQSLVELTITLPLLLLMFLGLIVVGSLMNQYMQLLGETRDAARYGARNDVELVASFDQGVYDEFLRENVLRLEPDEVAYAHHLVEFSVGISGTVGQDCITDITIQPTKVFSNGLLPPYADVQGELTEMVEAESVFQCDRFLRSEDDYYRQIHQAIIVEAQYPNPSALDLVPVNWFDGAAIRVLSIYRKL